ncbi:MAG TPA: DUF4157 domain-containing protein [Opitutaceae bacterium]|nr:DUF4157 domain-containing protein [Opitutaceae bacterium]
MTTQRISASAGRASSENPRSRQPSPPPEREPVLRRKCACGGAASGAAGECSECRNKKLQRKRAGWGRENASLAPPLVHEVLNSPGRPLDAGARAFLEPRFNYDFGGVRIHSGPLAAASARAVGAHAYAVGHDVVFGEGKYAPATTEGRKLLAHELTHVVQQAGAASTPGPDLKIGSENDASEHVADKTAEQIVHRGANGSPLQSLAPTPLRVARQNHDETADGGAPDDGGSSQSTELTDEDATKCTPLYLQKLCIYEVGGFNGDRSGVPDDQEWANLNKGCRDESGYDGPDVQLSDKETSMLKQPTCKRSSRKDAAARARDARIADALKRSTKYGNFGEEVVRILSDPVFQVSLAVAVGAYLALWLVPEPVVSKLAAALTTIAILSVGAFSVSTIVNLASAWSDLDTEAGNATTDDEIEAAAKKFGQRITAVEANLLVFLASLLIGGKLPGPKGLPPAEEALAGANRALAGTRQGGNVIEGPWGRARAVSQPGELAPPATNGNTALKIERAPVPEIDPAQLPRPKPANDNALPDPASNPATAPGKQRTPVTPVVPNPATDPDKDKKKKPPFVLKLPQQKAPHLVTYQGWIGVLQSDPNYDRGNPGQDDKWHQALRIGGAFGIPAEVYERGHRLGFVGEEGERRIRVPNWSRTKSVPMQVDHVIELQVTPPDKRDFFNSMANFELLDEPSNTSSGRLLQQNIADERKKQEAADPSLVGKVILFDSVQMDGGSPGERWNSDEIRAGEQLDVYEQRKGN